jgi:spore coat polysaccharide biosynthesis predicted glycosyltransferase SpsG
MAYSDLAIGAAGATSWERCCLGLPTIMVVLAENQRYAALKIEQAGAACLIESGGSLSDLLPSLIMKISESQPYLRQMIESAGIVTDGAGVHRVVRHLTLGDGCERFSQS